ncbi:MAG: peptide deformylase [Ruminiclostridium sp.]|nr:peptide deformylase [Ruminiclostridium sp.]
MAKRNIVKDGDEVLRKKCREVTVFDDKLWTLLDDMYETMQAANGVGLAAPQVGILRRVVVIDVGDENGKIELVNPVITSMKGKQRDLEGCLSAPDIWGYVVRPEKVKVKAQNRTGKEIEIEGEGLLARALCHEVDHLSGIMFLDKAEEFVSSDQLEDRKTKRK